MTTVLIDDSRTAEEFIAERRARRQDTYDEVWEGVYRVTPAGTAEHAHVQALVVALLVGCGQERGWYATGPCNIGRSGKDNYRVPDAALLAQAPGDLLYLDSALLVAEVRSPKDTTYQKRAFYAAHGIGELLVIDPLAGELEIWLRAGDTQYRQAASSAVLELTVDELRGRLLPS